MSDVVEYRSVVKIERVRGPIRKAWLPARDQHITFGVHSQVAEHYGVDVDDFPPGCHNARLPRCGRSRVTDRDPRGRAGGARHQRKQWEPHFRSGG